MTGRAFARIEPILLLFAAGAGIGSIFPLARAAADIPIPPLAYSFWVSLGTAVAMLAVARLSGARISTDRPHLRYGLIAGLLTFALPFAIIPLVIARIGSAIPAILQSLAPLATLVIVYALGLERPRFARMLGLGFGLLGALVIVFGRGGGTAEASLIWLGVATLAPVALAAGNVYRSTAWPPRAQALPLAAVTFFGATAWIGAAFAVLGLAGHPVALIAPLLSGLRILVAQSLCFAFGYACFFRLQYVAGPVFLSQISYVNTGVGLAFAVLWFAEPISPWIWLATVLILVGVAVVNRTQVTRAGG